MPSTHYGNHRDLMALRYLSKLDNYAIDPPLRYRIYRNYKQRYIATDNERLRIFVSGTTELEAFSEFKEWLHALITGYMLEDDDKLSSCGKELKNKLAARFKKCTETT